MAIISSVDIENTLIEAPSLKRDAAPKAVLVCKDPRMLREGVGPEIALSDRPITFGRGSENTVTLNAGGVSRTHTRIFPGDGTWAIADLGSTNGTVINGERVAQTLLRPGDAVTIGQAEFEYRVAPETLLAHRPINDTLVIEATEVNDALRRYSTPPAPTRVAPATPNTSRRFLGVTGTLTATAIVCCLFVFS